MGLKERFEREMMEILGKSKITGKYYKSGRDLIKYINTLDDQSFEGINDD